MSLSSGTRLGPYEIVCQLGAGGMGVVYEAKDPRLKRTVAIKLLPPDLTKDDTAKQRFLQEAQAASERSIPPEPCLWNGALDGSLASESVGRRADVRALGVVLHEMLTPLVWCV